MVGMPWNKIHPQPKLNMIGEHLRAGKELLGVPQGLDSFATLSVGYDFEQALFPQTIGDKLDRGLHSASRLVAQWV
jgi:hypothetical protein